MNMKEKQRTLLIAGSVLVLLLVVALLVPQSAVERRETGLTAEQIEAQEAVIEESKEAIKSFEDRNEENSEVYLNEYMIMGNAYARIGDLRGARGTYRDALLYAGTTEETEEIYLTLFELEERFENVDESRAVLNDAIEANPERFVYWEELINLEKTHNGLEGAELEEMIQESITATDRATGSLYTYAVFLEDAGRFDEALQYLREASALNPEYEAIYAQEISRVEALRNANQ
jgi:tetratricopeptide (TPR) repeat protein